MDSTRDANLANPLCLLENTTIMMLVVFKYSFVESFEPPYEMDNLLVRASQQFQYSLDESVKHAFTHEQSTMQQQATTRELLSKTGSYNQNVAASLFGFS